jgi:hypothetical protein
LEDQRAADVLGHPRIATSFELSLLLPVPAKRAGIAYIPRKRYSLAGLNNSVHGWVVVR